MLGAPSLRPPSSVIPHCEFFSLHLPTRTDSIGIDLKALCSCSYSGSAPGFQLRKKLCCIS